MPVILFLKLFNLYITHTKKKSRYFKFRNNQANDLSNDDIQFKKTDYYLLMHDIKQRKMVLFTFTDI